MSMKRRDFLASVLPSVLYGQEDPSAFREIEENLQDLKQKVEDLINVAKNFYNKFGKLDRTLKLLPKTLMDNYNDFTNQLTQVNVFNTQLAKKVRAENGKPENRDSKDFKKIFEEFIQVQQRLKELNKLIYDLKNIINLDKPKDA